MDEKLIELFEAYNNDELAHDAKEKFESKLRDDTSFEADFTLYNKISNTLASRFANERAAEELRSTIATFQKNTPKKERKVVRLFSIKKMLVAASVLLLVSISVFNYTKKPSFNDFANYDELSLVVRGADDDTQQKMLEKYFNDKQFNKALPLFESLLKDHPNDNKLILYKGLALLETNNYEAALASFNKLINGDNPLYKDIATWYKALAFLKQKDYQSCEKVLKSIKSESEYSEDAIKLLKSL